MILYSNKIYKNLKIVYYNKNNLLIKFLEFYMINWLKNKKLFSNNMKKKKNIYKQN